MTVMIVDDDAVIRMMLRDFMAGAGWDVYVAQDGGEALEKMKSVQMDFFISDVYMPVLDGIKFHRAVRAMPEYEKAPFLFVSGFDDELTRTCLKDPRIDGFFRKGRSLNELRDWVIYLTEPGKKSMPPSAIRGGL
jgi:CheY-like chemotaxis protein